MGIGSIGSVSFWQQDQNFWQQAQAQDQASTASNALITAMGSLMTNEFKGIASIANQTALDRVNSELEAAAQSAVQSSQSGCVVEHTRLHYRLCRHRNRHGTAYRRNVAIDPRDCSEQHDHRQRRHQYDEL